MKDFLKGKFVTGVVIVATVILAGVAIFTAMKLYSLRKEGVAPTAPESNPAASESSEIGNEAETCDLLTFNLNEPSVTISPTDEPNSTPTPGPTDSLTPTEPPRGGTSPTPTPTDAPSEPTPTTVPQNTPTPTSSYIAAASPTPAGATLPNAGLSLPSVITFIVGIFTLFIAVILAL